LPPENEVYRNERRRLHESLWLSRGRSLVQALRAVPIPGKPTTPEARARERYRLAVWATLTNVASRGLAMLLLVLGVRLTVGYLGTTRFGLWATFASMTAMLSLLDLGVGNALVNRVAHAAAADDPGALRRIVTGGTGLLALLGTAATAVLLVPALLLPWGELLRLSDPDVALEARQTAVVFAILFGVNLFGSGLLRILVGQQRSHEANMISACAAGCACVALWLAASRHAGVPVLLAATFGLQALAGFAAGAILLRRKVIFIRGSRAAMAVERPHLLRVGSLFVLLQLGTMLVWGGDSTILALLTSAGEVAVYAVAFRLFQFASQPFAMLNAPLWAAYADATARHDTGFIREALKRSLTVSVLGTGVLSCILLFAGTALISTWTRDAIVVPFQLLALFALWTTLDAGGNAFGIYLNGTGIVREQVWVVTAFCAVALPLKLLAASHAGASGLLAATITSYVLVVIGLYATVFRRRALAPIATPAT
jgi:O-antigen/teichoic acid export membrane protein